MKNEAIRKGASSSKEKGSALRDPAKALFDDAVDEARRLKRKHRAYYDRDPKRFRATVTKAHGRVYRPKPGPKTDQRIVKAAQERAGGAEWPPLYPKYIEHYSEMPAFTRSLAEEGFQRKINAYLQRHERLRRKWRKRTAGQH